MRKAADRQRLREAAAARSKAKGHLFGELDPHQAMNLEACDYMEESNRISLGLLEWKRRQERGSREPSQEGLPMKLAAAGMTTLPHWDSINPIPHLHRQPAMVEPVRRRHTDEKYADWINKMINILSGSGRSWALHEFFYSDIDRAWCVSCGTLYRFHILSSITLTTLFLSIGLTSINSKWILQS